MSKPASLAKKVTSKKTPAKNMSLLHTMENDLQAILDLLHTSGPMDRNQLLAAVVKEEKPGPNRLLAFDFALGAAKQDHGILSRQGVGYWHPENPWIKGSERSALPTAEFTEAVVRVAKQLEGVNSPVDARSIRGLGLILKVKGFDREQKDVTREIRHVLKDLRASGKLK